MAGILVVDDDSTLRQLLRVVLQRSGHEVETAEEAAAVRRIGADLLQGFFFGRPSLAAPN